VAMNFAYGAVIAALASAFLPLLFYRSEEGIKYMIHGEKI